LEILFVLYKSGLEFERVKQPFRHRSATYARVGGLLQKFYLHDPVTGEVGGIYVFDNRTDLDAFLSSDSLKNILQTYQAGDFAACKVFQVPLALSNQPPDRAASSAASAADPG
jgi:Putative mono-oxygenase ydhR